MSGFFFWMFQVVDKITAGGVLPKNMVALLWHHPNLPEIESLVAHCKNYYGVLNWAGWIVRMAESLSTVRMYSRYFHIKISSYRRQNVTRQSHAGDGPGTT
jgi:hypothetical protein